MPHYQLPDQCKSARHLSNNGSYPQYKTPPADIYRQTGDSPPARPNWKGARASSFRNQKIQTSIPPCALHFCANINQHPAQSKVVLLKQPLMKHRPQASQGGMRAPGPTKEHEPLSKLTGNDQAKALAPIQNS